MEQLESLNTIVDHFGIKKSTLAIFSLDQLYLAGKQYVTLASRPHHIPYDSPLDCAFENSQNSSFCSIFSEAENSSSVSHNTSILSMHHENCKLGSDSDILSSDFEPDIPISILTSEGQTDDSRNVSC